ncbi:MAG: hypothetical protein DME36_12215 [Verrucomicrobia bacterium]|nr:MAG: hypothetical protein DME36_12215 [Verrucomicrobiota bacterium]
MEWCSSGSGKSRDVPRRIKLRQGVQKNVLNQILDGRVQRYWILFSRANTGGSTGRLHHYGSSLNGIPLLRLSEQTAKIDHHARSGGKPAK